jgi:hypothetical protein
MVLKLVSVKKNPIPLEGVIIPGICRIWSMGYRFDITQIKNGSFLEGWLPVGGMLKWILLYEKGSLAIC